MSCVVGVSVFLSGLLYRGAQQLSLLKKPMVNTAAADLLQILVLRLCFVGNCITDTGPLSPPAAILPFPTLNTGWGGLGLYSYVSAGQETIDWLTMGNEVWQGFIFVTLLI